jgi:signal peptidase II
VRRLPLDRLRPTATAFVVAAVVVASDLLTKAWARRALASQDRHVIGPVDLHLGFNPGFAFSFGRTNPTLSAALSFAALAGFGALALFARPGAPAVGFGLMVGGGLANLLDRLSSPGRHVTDFIAIGRFPVFNVADASITLGVVVLLVVALLGRPILNHR